MDGILYLLVCLQVAFGITDLPVLIDTRFAHLIYFCNKPWSPTNPKPSLPVPEIFYALVLFNNSWLLIQTPKCIGRRNKVQFVKKKNQKRHEYLIWKINIQGTLTSSLSSLSSENTKSDILSYFGHLLDFLAYLNSFCRSRYFSRGIW